VPSSPPTVARFALTPATPRAARRLTASLRIRDDEALERSHVTCSARVGGRPLRATKVVRGLVATCRWTVPRSARGKLLRGSVRVRAGGETLARAFSRRVR
jgi:hypothetical protein